MDLSFPVILHENHVILGLPTYVLPNASHMNTFQKLHSVVTSIFFLSSFTSPCSLFYWHRVWFFSTACRGLGMFRVEKISPKSPSQGKFNTLKEVRKKWNFFPTCHVLKAWFELARVWVMGSQLYICTFYGHELCCMSSRVLFTKSNNTLLLGFQENQSFLHIMLRNYQFMCSVQSCWKHK